MYNESLLQRRRSTVMLDENQRRRPRQDAHPAKIGLRDLIGSELADVGYNHCDVQRVAGVDRGGRQCEPAVLPKARLQVEVDLGELRTGGGV